MVGLFIVDEDGYIVSVGDKDFDFIYIEFELLKYFVGYFGRVFIWDFLLLDVWGYDYYGGIWIVDVYICCLCVKVGLEYEGYI